VFAAMLDVAGAIPIVEVVVGLGMTLALKRIVDAMFEGDPDGASARYERIVYLMYALANLLDIVGNAVYELFLQITSTPAQATNMAAWLSGTALAGMLVLLLCVRYAAQGVDRPPLHRKALRILPTLRSGTFWRFAGVGVLLSGVRMMFRHLSLTLIQWFVIVEGPKSHYPLMQGINPFIIVCLTPFMPWFLQRLRGGPQQDHYGVFMVGTCFSALGPLVWGLSLLGGMNVYAATALGVGIFSVGEAVWSPRFLQYSFEVAPPGSEALFAAMAGLPQVAMKLPVAYLSNVLMEHFCPSTPGAECQSANLWMAIGLLATTTPLGLALLARVLRDQRHPKKVLN
jgi:dipeptide/tripeptide permease